MKIAYSSIAAVAIAFAGPALAADAHDHGGHHQASETKLELNHGRKWATDAALRQGMENIRAALAADKRPDYRAVAAKVNAEVAGIVQNCKLEPAADAELHKVIAQMMAGAEAMEGKEKGVSARAGAERVKEALEQYARHFEHPGWKKL